MACEGTRFTEAKRQLSLKYAAEKNLPQLKYHLLPRTRGFSLIMKGAKGKSEAKRVETFDRPACLSSSSGSLQLYVGLLT